MHPFSLRILYILLAFWALIFSMLLFAADITNGMEFVPIVNTAWRWVFYATAFALPVLLVPLALYSIWKTDKRSRKSKLLHTIPWIAVLIPWGATVLIVLFVFSFGDGLTNAIVPIHCSGQRERFYLRDANAWMDDDTGSVNRVYILYREQALTLEPLASIGVHTRGDVGYAKVDITSPSTTLELQPIQSAHAQARYLYIPALKELRCE